MKEILRYWTNRCGGSNVLFFMRFFFWIVLLTGFFLYGSLWAQDAKPDAPAAATTDKKEEKPAAQPDPAEKFSNAILEGFKCEQKGDFAGAIAAYTLAVNVQEDSPVALIRRGEVYARMGKKQEAMLDLRRATSPRTRPKTVTDFASLGWLRATSPLAEFRDASLAISYGNKAVSFADSAENYDVLAAGYAELGNFQKARDSIMQGMKYYPEDPRIKGMKERLKLYIDHQKFRDDWWPDGVDR